MWPFSDFHIAAAATVNLFGVTTIDKIPRYIVSSGCVDDDNVLDNQHEREVNDSSILEIL